MHKVEYILWPFIFTINKNKYLQLKIKRRNSNLAT